MIKLVKYSKSAVVTALASNGTSEKKIFKTLRKIGDRVVSLGVDKDEKFTIAKVGDSYGVSKRATYARNYDEPVNDRGVTLALFRAVGLS